MEVSRPWSMLRLMAWSDGALQVKAKAEAEQMAKKADAWKEYQEAALVDMMLKVKPWGPRNMTHDP
jgi:hypothetical protein